jgi:alanine dehydrogenase
MVRTIAVLREAKTDAKGREIENRVILTPPLISRLKERFHGLQLYVESNAGAKIDFADPDYEQAGAYICSHAKALEQDLVLGVKETRAEDFPRLRDNLFLSYQHFAQSRERTEAAIKTRATYLAYETMEDASGNFPCLAPMSEAAAKVIARHADEYALLSKKIITSGLPETGLHGARVAILGGGSVGRTATEEFSERGCEVTLLEKNPARAKTLADYFKEQLIRYPKVKVLELSQQNVRDALSGALFLVTAMYTSGKRPEKLVTIDLLRTMVPGGCVYPVDIDQGGGVDGVVETSILEPFDLPALPGTEVFFFAPPNLPSMGARTTSEALGTVILPYLIEIVEKGIDKAAEENKLIASGLNIKAGHIIHPGLATVFPALK